MRRTPSGLNVPNVNCGALSSPPPCGWWGGGTLGGGTPLLGFMVERASVFVVSGGGGHEGEGVSRRLASRVCRASRRSRLDESVRAPEASPRAWVLAPGGSRQSTHLLRARRLVRGRRRSGRVRRVYECVNRGVGGVRTHVAGVERTRGGQFAPRVTSRREAIGKWRQRAARRRCSSADSASRKRRSCDSFRTHPLPAIDSPLSPRPKPRPAPLGTGAPLPPLSVVGECATGGGT